MRKLLLCLTLLELPSCSGVHSAPVSKPVSPCKVPVAPEPPELEIGVCEDFNGGHVCMSPEAAVKLGRYLTQLANVETAIQGCNLVERVPE